MSFLILCFSEFLNLFFCPRKAGGSFIWGLFFIFSCHSIIVITVSALEMREWEAYREQTRSKRVCSSQQGLRFSVWPIYCKKFSSLKQHVYLIYRDSLFRNLKIIIPIFLANHFKKAGQKLSGLLRINHYLTLDRKLLLLNSVVKSEFSYYPLTWMFTSRSLNIALNSIEPYVWFTLITSSLL